MHRVVIVGGGFAGLNVARQLRRAPVSVTLIDRRNFHLFQPLLYQVATGGLSPANIAAPLRALFKRQVNAEILLGEVVNIDAAARKVHLRDGEIGYDTLVLATGVKHQYFGHDAWEPFAPGLKTVEDATEIRRRVFTAFERAEREADPDFNPNPDLTRIRAWLTFVIVGGGPTGVELAGMLCELAHETLRGNFRHIDPAQAEVIVVEATDRILPSFDPRLSIKARASLEHLGAIIRTHTTVVDIKAHEVTVRGAASDKNSAITENTEVIAAHTVLWAAGVQASALGKCLELSAGAKLDRAGRVMVEHDCSLPGHPEIFVIGDLANLNGPDGKQLPGVAQPAIQEGRYVGKLISKRLLGKTVPPFRYRNLGNLATIGRHSAVAEMGPLKFSGLFAWIIWLFVHLMNIVQFQSRVLVFVQWMWMYLTRNRSARLITQERRQDESAQQNDSAASRSH